MRSRFLATFPISALSSSRSCALVILQHHTQRHQPFAEWQRKRKRKERQRLSPLPGRGQRTRRPLHVHRPSLDQLCLELHR